MLDRIFNFDFPENPAVIFKDEIVNYNPLLEIQNKLIQKCEGDGIKVGDIVYLIADYSPQSIAMLLALIRLKAIIIPITSLHYEKQKANLDFITPQFIIELSALDEVRILKANKRSIESPLIEKIRLQKNPGLIILSSGSTGKCKAIVHDIALLLEGLKASKKRLKVLSFLLFDHIGGLNSIFSSLISGNCIVIPPSRTPQDVALCIEQHQVDVFITSPSFLNLMKISNTFIHENLKSLQQINYGSEIMPAILLSSLKNILPQTKFVQAYGLSELGVLPTLPNNSDDRYLAFDSKNILFRVRNNKLEIKSKFSMLGYLNAPHPFTEDGWFMTGDLVEENNGNFRILGRESELINIGGEKVFPVEVENILLELPFVEDVTVCGEKNLILGNIVVAKIKLKEGIENNIVKESARKYCLTKLPAFKVPQKFYITSDYSHNDRFKKIRTVVLD